MFWYRIRFAVYTHPGLVASPEILNPKYKVNALYPYTVESAMFCSVNISSNESGHLSAYKNTSLRVNWSLASLWLHAIFLLIEIYEILSNILVLAFNAFLLHSFVTLWELYEQTTPNSNSTLSSVQLTFSVASWFVIWVFMFTEQQTAW